MSDLDLTTGEMTTDPAPAPDPLAGVATERLLERALERLSDAGAPFNGIAAAHVEEALRQVRKARRPACGGESDAR